MHFTCRSFIGRPSKNSWSQYWENEPDDRNLISQRGHLFGLVSFNVDDKAETSSLGRELIAEINQYYFSSVEDPAPNRLKAVMTDFVSGLDFQFSDLSLILAVVLDGQLHLVTLNSGRCFLHRGSAISPILIGQNGQVMSISGPLQDGDRIFFCTDEFYTQFSWEKIKSVLSLPHIQDIEEEFLAKLYSLDDQQGLAAIYVIVNTDPLDLGVQEITPPQPAVNEIEVIDTPKSHPSKSKATLFSKLFSRRPVYITHHENTSLSRRKKINIIFALLALTALITSAFFGLRKNQSQLIEKQYQDLKTQVETKLSNAKTVKKLDLKAALNLGKEATGIIDKMASLKIHSTEVSQLREQATTLLSQTGSAKDFVPEMFYDTSLITPKPAYSQIISSRESIYLLDSTNGRIDLLDISHTSTNQISSSSSLKGSSVMAVNSGQVYVLNNSQIYEVQKNNLISKINLSDQLENFEGGQIQFWNGSLYLLTLSSQSDSTIWKFAPSASGFNQGQIWLKDKQTLPVDTTSFAINGKVWVISQNGTIAPYSLGIREDFNLSTTQSIDSAANIVTAPDINVFAFSSSSNLVHIHHKDGQSPLLYNLGDRRINSLAFDSTGKFLYILCQDQKIYKVSL